MTLTRILRIEERYLKYEDLRALAYCEKRWQQEGFPIKRWDLVNFIERMLKELQDSGVGYPKVLLLRKKEIQRRAFTLEEPEWESTRSQENALQCSICGDSGWEPVPYPNAAPSYRPCSCGAGTVRRERFEKAKSTSTQS